MNSLVEKLRISRKNPSVLRLKILKVRGEAPNLLIFVFEGVEDIPIYEEWMRKISDCPQYEPVAGAGKQQLVALHELLVAAQDDLIRQVFFFVDRDFDPPCVASPNLHELAAYSFENLICNEAVVESLLRDEFRLAGAVSDRQNYLNQYRKAYKDFISICKPIDFYLFVSQCLSVPLSMRPEKIVDIACVELGSACATWKSLDEVIKFEREFSLFGDALVKEFESLSEEICHRGKFSMMFLRRWLKEMASQIKKLGENDKLQVIGDPSSLPSRRFASVVPAPDSLIQFVAALRLSTSC